jgi:hypothetical protein
LIDKAGEGVAGVPLDCDRRMRPLAALPARNNVAIALDEPPGLCRPNTRLCGQRQQPVLVVFEPVVVRDRLPPLAGRRREMCRRFGYFSVVCVLSFHWRIIFNVVEVQRRLYVAPIFL